MDDLKEDTVRRIAELARLQLSAAEIEKFTPQLSEILAYIEKLNAVDTSEIEPLIHPVDIDSPLRPDESRPSPGADAMLACAPEQLFDSFKVPQVMSGGH